MSFYRVYDPPGTLAKLVKDIQVFHIRFDEEEKAPPGFITCLANTEQNLYFILNDIMNVVPASGVEIPAPPAVITGPKTRPVGLLLGRDHLMIKVCFHPTGTYRLLDTNMTETVNKGLDAGLLWGDGVGELLERLRGIPAYDDMASMVSAFIEQKAAAFCRNEEPIDEIAIRMLDPLEQHTTHSWAKESCLSLRQFERNFITRVGIPPKLFVRIGRFEYAMRIKNDFPGKTWAEIAAEANYTDSAHLLKDFKEFAEFPPSSFYLKPTSGYSELPTG